MNGWLYFTGLNESANNQYWLWRTDGEACEPIVRLGTGGETISSITRITRAGNRLYMRVTSNFTGTELWTSDGTAQGTGIVIDLNPGSASGITQFDILSSGVLGERLVFRGFHPTFGLELFITDGTANGTYCLGDLNPGIAYGTAWSNGNTVQVVGSKIFVAGTSPEFGTELWMSDGTPNSLTRITDLFPGSESSNPSRFTTDGSRLFFVAEGCSTGKELYAADTNGNVTLLAETAPGPDHTYIQHTTWFNGSLYFTHNHPVYGRELFRIRTTPCPADFNADTVIDLFDYLDFVAAFAANDPAADFNADTTIDFFDYLDFVESFAAGC
jgi:ELWxxDGT repeat protein